MPQYLTDPDVGMVYNICAAMKGQNAGEASADNSLTAAWPELIRQAAAIQHVGGELQGALDW